MEKGKWVKSNCEKEENTSVECRMLKNKNGEKGIPKREKMDKDAFFFFRIQHEIIKKENEEYEENKKRKYNIINDEKKEIVKSGVGKTLNSFVKRKNDKNGKGKNWFLN